MTEIQRKFAILNRIIYVSGPCQQADGLAISLLTTHNASGTITRLHGKSTTSPLGKVPPQHYTSAVLCVTLEQDGRVYVEVRDMDLSTGLSKHHCTVMFDIDWWDNPLITKAVDSHWLSYVASIFVRREALERNNKIAQLSIELLQSSA
jgi:hypothetical protein